MWADRKRLLVMAGLALALGGVCVYIYAFRDKPSAPDAAELMALLEKDAADAGKAEPAPDTGGSTRNGPVGGSDSGTPSRSGRSAGGRETNPLVLRQVEDVARSPKPEHLPALKLAARNPDPAIREAATFGLGRLGKESDPAFLMQVLKEDSDPTVLVAAATALGDLKCWEAGPRLIELLEHADARVRSRAAASLNKIIGVDLGIRGSEAARQMRIKRIREWWPEFYAKHQERKSVRG